MGDQEDSRVRYLRLARNAGSHAAFTAGLRPGRAAIVPCCWRPTSRIRPIWCPKLLQRWRAGNDVVWAVRAVREGISWTTQRTADIYYGLHAPLGLAEHAAPRGRISSSLTGA